MLVFLFIIFVAPIIALFAIASLISRPRPHVSLSTPLQTEEPVKDQTDDQINYASAYQPSWLFSMAEKQFYRKLNDFAVENGYTVFAKVRLMDLLTPRNGHPNYKTLRNKVQSKHVDFVLCDEKLVARHVVELDDSSHKQHNRKERDDFVDTVLRSCGYNVIHMFDFDEAALQQAITPKP